MKAQSRRYQHSQPDTPHPPDSLWFVPLPRTNEAKYVHTLPVIRTDKAYFVRQFNRTKYPCKGCYFATTYSA